MSSFCPSARGAREVRVGLFRRRFLSGCQALIAALLLILSAAVQAQDYTYATDNIEITITGYSGPAEGALVVPDTITGTDDLFIIEVAAADLANLEWSTVSTNTLTGGSSYFSDSDWADHRSRVYRLRTP